jgi:hypothetical protein
VSAFASIDYRLSPHPNYPQDPTVIPPSQLCNAKHPDHILDVRAGLLLLQEKYGFGSNYVLIGHSCGATIALQLLMGSELSTTEPPKTPNDFNDDALDLPRAILGVCGIYDLRSLVENHSTISIYREFVVDAFGQNEDFWDFVSPARYEKFLDAWQEGKLMMLVSSRGDELIEDAQIDSMSERLQAWQSLNSHTLVVMKNELQQGHDDIWGNGIELANVVALSLQKLMDIDRQ